MTPRDRMVASASDIRRRVERLAGLHRELLAAEAKERGGKLGAAAAPLVGAGLLVVHALGFLLAKAAVVLALALPRSGVLRP